MSSAKHIPQRTCVGCRATTAKREFVRVVRTESGAVEVDTTGKRNGRGAYLCARRECWDEALKKDRLTRALRTAVAATDRQALMSYAERFEPAIAGAGV